MKYSKPVEHSPFKCMTKYLLKYLPTQTISKYPIYKGNNADDITIEGLRVRVGYVQNLDII